MQIKTSLLPFALGMATLVASSSDYPWSAIFYTGKECDHENYVGKLTDSPAGLRHEVDESLGNIQSVLMAFDHRDEEHEVFIYNEDGKRFKDEDVEKALGHSDWNCFSTDSRIAEVGIDVDED